jgi:hypothetical protein
MPKREKRIIATTRGIADSRYEYELLPFLSFLALLFFLRVPCVLCGERLL